MTMRTIYAAAAIATIAVQPATAQNVSLPATYEEVTLDTGFDPDPYNVSVYSGGTIDSRHLGGDCTGFIADAPDVRLHFRGGSLPLIISVNADIDTTLVVNAPDGNWYCSDDGANGLNPSISFGDAPTGRYEIWIGTYGSNSVEPASLSISELYSQ